MKYKVKLVKNNTETYEDTLHITNMLPSIINNSMTEKAIVPFDGSYANACLAMEETVEKRNDNIDPFGLTLKGGGNYDEMTGEWTITGINGHIGSLCFSHKDTLLHWDNNNYLVTGGIDGGIGDHVYFVDPDNKCFYTLTETAWSFEDMTLKKFEIIEPTFGWEGMTHTSIDKKNNKTCKVVKTGTVPKETFKDNYYFNPSTFGEEACSKSEISYGDFHGHSIVQNDKYLIGFNFFKYNIIPVSSYTRDENGFLFTNNVTVNSKSYVEVVLIDKKTFEYQRYVLTNIDNDDTTTIPAGRYDLLSDFYDDGDIIQCRVAAADDNNIYIIAKCYINGVADYMIYALPIAELANNPQFSYYADYDASICHTINRRNGYYQCTWNSYGDEVLRIGRKDGVNCFSYIFKAGMSAISNFNLDVIESDSLVITIETEE